ncbi:hypothetical protein BCR35DRAFT_188249 [Leucosporidium creatinivorum]|uniref:Uncharacterized protein n=1 Tax=Leucosporidium creatinivorum TaxID=106004 RepID=A0A1Y2DUL5_9BASI|nr:hypothetical protein BCR35DRAFT_188249 [Leucosporidium creatinivorum]
MLPLAGASDVTGLVSREEWLRLGGFGDGGAEEGGEEDEKPRPMPMPSSSRWSRGDVDARTSFADLPSPHYTFPSPSPVPPSFALEHTSSAEPHPSLPPLPQTTKPTRLTSTTRLAAPRPLAPPPPPTSTPSFSLTPLPSLPPSLSNPSKSHARRHSTSHIPRPRNAFILFRQHFVSSTPSRSIPPSACTRMPTSRRSLERCGGE